MKTEFNLDAAIRKIKDFPKEGILFYDITGILNKPDAFNYCIEKMVQLYGDKQIDAVAAIEARGFFFASPFAYKMGLPIIVIRKKGKLPGETFSQSFTLEYGEDTIEMHKSDIREGMHILLVDDLIATGGTLKASCEMIKSAGANVDEIFAVIGLPFLNYRKILDGYNVTTLIDYHSE
jgi:adenine phosphoribosyltransferase